MASSDLHLGLVKLGNPVPVQDLIKANANDDRRVQHLRQLLLSQLDLIQKQSEVIAAKDQQIRELKRQNENLQCQLEQHPKSSKSRKQVRILKKIVYIQATQGYTIRKVKFLSKDSILTNPQHFHVFFTQIFLDNFSREIKVVNS